MPFEEKILNTNIEKSKRLGAFIRYHREEEKMSLSFMANTVKISKAYLSEIEHGKKTPQPYTLQQILKVLEIKFYPEMDLFYQSENLLKQLFENYSNLNEQEEIRCFDILNENSYFEYSYGFLQYYLMKFMYELRFHHNQTKINHYRKCIEKYINLLNEDEQSIFYDLCGQENIRKENYLEAAMLLNRSLACQSSITEPMVHYHLCAIHQYLNKAAIALSHCFKAQELFNKQFAFERMLYLAIYEANCYSGLRSYDKAEELYLFVLQKTNLTSLKHIQITIYNNLSWNALKQENYKKCVTYVKQAIQLSSKFIDIFIYLPISYYYLSDFDMCKASIEKYQSTYTDTNYHKYVLEALTFMMNHDFIQALNSLKKSLSLCKEYEMRIVILKQICFVLNKLKAYPELCEYQDMLLHAYEGY